MDNTFNNGLPSSQPRYNEQKRIRYKLPEEEDTDTSTAGILVPFQTIRNTVFLVIFGFVTVGAVTILLFLYITVRPFSLGTYRRLACTMSIAPFFDVMSLLLPNMKIILSGDSDAISSIGISVLVSNHCMEGDWLSIFMLARVLGLRGSVKAFLQRSNSTSPKAHSPDEKRIIPNSASTPILKKDTSNDGNGRGFSALSKKQIPRNHSQPSTLNASASSPKRIDTKSSSGLDTQDTDLITSFLNKILDFPLLSSENTQNYVQDRNELLSLLKSFSTSVHYQPKKNDDRFGKDKQNGHASGHSQNSMDDGFDFNANVPIQLLLFPEGWPIGQNRRSMIEKSIEFAKREGRPQLKHLLLPRTTGFYASLDSLSPSSPNVYDVTMAHEHWWKHGVGGIQGRYFRDGRSWWELWMQLMNGKLLPREFHVRIKRFSVGEVLSDPQWLDKQWIQKDRLLDHYARYGSFPNMDSRNYNPYQNNHRRFRPGNITMNTRTYCLEGSLSAMFRLGIIPFFIPIMMFFAIPLLVTVGWMLMAYQAFWLYFPGGIGDFSGSESTSRAVSKRSGKSNSSNKGNEGNGDNHDLSPTGSPATVDGTQTDSRGGGAASVNSGGTDSAFGTPFFPSTPFASPLEGSGYFRK